MKKSPLARMKEVHGSKEKLVEALVAFPEGVLDRPEADDKDAWKKQLQSASNAKLMRLHAMGSDVSKRFGSKEKLVDALLGLQKRGKDADFRAKLVTLPIGKLLDRYKSVERASREAQAAKK
ncbi:MAG TPA: hypothetical protein PKE31_03820 [Pseudomonadota bacterium]|nr:hypothetical protein [Pseudomonadota bacterium]